MWLLQFFIFCIENITDHVTNVVAHQWCMVFLPLGHKIPTHDSVACSWTSEDPLRLEWGNRGNLLIIAVILALSWMRKSNTTGIMSNFWSFETFFTELIVSVKATVCKEAWSFVYHWMILGHLGSNAGQNTVWRIQSFFFQTCQTSKIGFKTLHQIQADDVPILFYVSSIVSLIWLFKVGAVMYHTLILFINLESFFVSHRFPMVSVTSLRCFQETEAHHITCDSLHLYKEKCAELVAMWADILAFSETWSMKCVVRVFCSSVHLHTFFSLNNYALHLPLLLSWYEPLCLVT